MGKIPVPSMPSSLSATLRNIAESAPDLVTAARRGDPEAILEIDRIIASQVAAPRNIGFVGSDSTDMIPFGTRGPGVMAGNELIPQQPRGMTVVDADPLPDLPQRGILAIEGPAAPPRRPLSMGKKMAAAGAAAAGAGGAYWAVNQPEPSRKAKGSSTADLAAETNAPPSVMTQEPAPIRAGYREQALAMQKDLNERRRKAGGEIPEAQEMRREIQRLFDLADKETNSAARKGVAPKPSGANDHLGQARQILADLNAGRIPPAQRSQAQRRMQQLYDMANRQDNSRTTAYPRS